MGSLLPLHVSRRLLIAAILLVLILATMTTIAFLMTSRPAKGNVEVAVSSSVGGTFIPSLLAYAHDHKVWAKYDLNITLIPFRGGEASMIAALERGRVSIGEGSPASIALAMQKGAKVRMIATYSVRSPYSVMIGSKLPIKSLDDFRGVRMGLSQLDSSSHNSAKMLAFLKGWTEGNQYRLVTFSTLSEAIGAFEQGKVDALLAPYTSLLSLEKEKGRFVAHLSDLFPTPFVDRVIWGTEDLIQRDSKLVREILIGLKDAYAKFESNEPETLNWIATYYRTDLDTARKIWRFSKGVFTSNLQLDTEALRIVKDLLERSEATRTLPPLAKWYEDRITSSLP